MSSDESTAPPATVGMTLQVYVPPEDATAARTYYSALFGYPPVFEPHDDFFEWPPIPGQECWFQLAARPDASPLTNRVRFRVTDLAEAVAFLDDQGIAHSQPSQLPDVVAFVDFADPWNNQLGYYQDLTPSGRQPEYRGTSVTDSTRFTSFAAEH